MALPVIAATTAQTLTKDVDYSYEVGITEDVDSVSVSGLWLGLYYDWDDTTDTLTIAGTPRSEIADQQFVINATGPDGSVIRNVSYSVIDTPPKVQALPTYAIQAGKDINYPIILPTNVSSISVTGNLLGAYTEAADNILRGLLPAASGIRIKGTVYEDTPNTETEFTLKAGNSGGTTTLTGKIRLTTKDYGAYLIYDASQQLAWLDLYTTDHTDTIQGTVNFITTTTVTGDTETTTQSTYEIYYWVYIDSVNENVSTSCKILDTYNESYMPIYPVAGHTNYLRIYLNDNLNAQNFDLWRGNPLWFQNSYVIGSEYEWRIEFDAALGWDPGPWISETETIAAFSEPRLTRTLNETRTWQPDITMELSRYIGQGAYAFITTSGTNLSADIDIRFLGNAFSNVTLRIEDFDPTVDSATSWEFNNGDGTVTATAGMHSATTTTISERVICVNNQTADHLLVFDVSGDDGTEAGIDAARQLPSSLPIPSGVANIGNDQVAVTNQNNNRIHIFASDFTGTQTTTVVSQVKQLNFPSGWTNPRGITSIGEDTIAVVDSGRDDIGIFDISGANNTTMTLNKSFPLASTWLSLQGIAYLGNDKVAVLDNGLDDVGIFDISGTSGTTLSPEKTLSLPSGWPSPQGISAYGTDTVAIVDNNQDDIGIFDISGADGTTLSATKILSIPTTYGNVLGIALLDE